LVLRGKRSKELSNTNAEAHGGLLSQEDEEKEELRRLMGENSPNQAERLLQEIRKRSPSKSTLEEQEEEEKRKKRSHMAFHIQEQKRLGWSK
jgi:indole-3-glycerol phosphate synthase